MRLGNYEWDPEADLIAEGTFAEVFRARDTNTAGRTVALKIYKEAVAKGTSGSSGQKKYTLEKEFQKVDRLSHTNIITYYGLDYIHGQDTMGRKTSNPVLVMEYAEGGTLADFLKTSPYEGVRDKLIRDIIRGMGYLHDEGILHRDLKPGNILITKNRRGEPVAKIADFGISRDILTDKTIEQSYTEGIGTPHYMAPEQFYKKKYGLNGELSERTDIWALGVIIYRMLTGRLPFGEGERDLELVREAITGKAADFDTVPVAYRGLLEKCLAKTAAGRADSAASLVGFLDNGASVPSPLPSSPVPLPASGEESKSVGKGDSVDDLPTMPPLSAQPAIPQMASGKKTGVATWIGIVGLLIIVAMAMIYFNSHQSVRSPMEETKTGSLSEALPDSVAREEADGGVAIKAKVEEAPPEQDTAEPRRQAKERPAIPVSRSQSDTRAKTPALPMSLQKLLSDMVKVEGGTFTMGCTPEQGGDCDDSEKPTRRVTLTGFDIGKYEVTQGQWMAVMGTNIRQQRDKANPEWLLYGEGDNFPMYYISWEDVQEFLQKLNAMTGKNFRLPTEAEWEYAARGGNKSRGYKYPGSDNLDEVAWHMDFNDIDSKPVGRKQPNELGLYDMAGNVSEWCQDFYSGKYPEAAQVNPTGPAKGNGYVVRGGSWNYIPENARVSARFFGWRGEERTSQMGFRLVLGH